MEPPEEMTGEAILKSKVELLKSVETLSLHDGASTFLGQFAASEDGAQKGYCDDATVPEGSRCPTFAACVLKVDNDRWRGVPFLLSAGKGLDERLCEFRVRFRPQNFNRRLMGADAANELIMRVQPDEALYTVSVAKQPGLNAGLGKERRTPVAMGLRYASQFGDGSPFVSGDAYERMLLNASRGDQALSVSAAELVEAWRIFTPLLHQIDERKPQPVVHPFGKLPDGYLEWALREHNVDVLPLPASWGGKEAEKKLNEQIAAHAAAREAAQRAVAVQALEDDLAFGY